MQVRSNSEQIALPAAAKSRTFSAREPLRKHRCQLARRHEAAEGPDVFHDGLQPDRRRAAICSSRRSLFAGRIQLGTLMQDSRCFWPGPRVVLIFINAIRAWRHGTAVVDRLAGFEHQIARTRQRAAISDVTVGQARSDVALSNRRYARRDAGWHATSRKDEFHVRGRKDPSTERPISCGKTTLLRAISGLFAAFEGVVSPRSKRPRARLAAKAVSAARIASNSHRLSSPGIGYSRRKDRRSPHQSRLGDLAQSLDFIESWSARLSLGEQQRIAFAPCLAGKARHLADG